MPKRLGTPALEYYINIRELLIMLPNKVVVKMRYYNKCEKALKKIRMCFMNIDTVKTWLYDSPVFWM